MNNYSQLYTEAINENSRELDKLPASEIVKIINDEDKTVALAVEKVLPQIAKAAELVAEKLSGGGRLFYTGAGTSGRLGVLDASECPPTYGVSPDVVQGLIAGGYDATYKSIEDAEDDPQSIVKQMKERNFSSKDICFGISASGTAECVIGTLDYAKSIGAATIALSCNEKSKISSIADIAITPIVGPEVVSGSTRMKSGTAQKMVLNMVSTTAMVLLGKVKGNRMVCMIPSNKKLLDRAARTVMAETGASFEEALNALERSGNVITDAIELLKK
ncbi:MAG: N-acetylmuramic acid 6-phosphate etherase [Eubacteriales bacterium]|nr:N-acetylmuramic acid 6-phosphate etherase [Eubacteriales bacterium]MDD4474627.1 N-acetylmuramic acid 6-phosphate etherase [Eubacteriales bacterium]